MITTPTNNEYHMAMGTLANAFGRDWERVQDQVDTSWMFLSHISPSAWKDITEKAINEWDGWPRNLVKAVKEIYINWRDDKRTEPQLVECGYCNSVGYFSGGKPCELIPGKTNWYWHTWRCAACRNWYGVLGDRIPAAYPLEVKSDGYVISFFGKRLTQDEISRHIIGAIVDPIGREPGHEV